MPILCPFCGSKDIVTDMVDWEAHSLEPMDADNTAIISENQCNECANSFWS